LNVEIVERAAWGGSHPAIVDRTGQHSYGDLVAASARAAAGLLADRGDLAGQRVAFMVEPSFDYVRIQWGIWRAGGLAVPLCLTHPPAELAYVLDDSRPAVVVAGPQYEDVLRPLAAERDIRYLSSPEVEAEPGVLPEVDEGRRALMLYTSGTTGRPKGVVTTHHNLAAQISSLIEAWGWSPDDRILLTLPLHHVHGIVNVVSSALWAGAVCEMLPAFDAEATWERLSSGDHTLYMAVPTIYHRLIGAWDNADSERRRRWSEGCRRLRLMVSGSAALPVPILERWRQISGHTLLERYGMTEIGMGLSNPLVGERLPGRVGRPLPGVEVRLVDEEERVVADGSVGQIQVRGDTVFLEYWDRPEATAAAFADGRWFRTGDVAIRQEGIYRILGRESVDIIKTGGEKVSALEIEEILLGHEQVAECAVVGVEDPEWGQRVVAAIVPRPGPAPAIESLRTWCRGRLAPYKVPKEWRLVDKLPRNAMGKVTKPDVVLMLHESVSAPYAV
jgi:malonyl-CoA/methylmalonyl-CoA synthetase